MIMMRETNENGSTKEITFDTTLEAARALGSLFNVDLGESLQRQQERQQINDTLRAQFARGRSTTDPKALIERARRGM